MCVEDYEALTNFYTRHKTCKASEDITIMEVFKFFASRDMILEATVMLGNNETEIINTVQQIDDEKDEKIIWKGISQFCTII